MSHGLVDVVLPVFNPGAEFRETMASIVGQSYRNLRVIVVDDGSNEESKTFIRSICDLDERIELTRLSKNQGGGAARNLALTISSAPYVAFCDADDRWPPNKIEIQISLLQSGADFTHTDMRELTFLPDRCDYRWRFSKEIIALEDFLETTDIFCSSVVLKREIIQDARFGSMRARHPFKFWCHILSRGYKSVRAPGCYFDYVKRKQSVSSNKFKMLFYTLLAYIFYVPDKGVAFKKVGRRFVKYLRDEKCG